MSRPLLWLIQFYRIAVSPSLGQHCRYYPSCSAYAAGAVRSHGVVTGLRLAVLRLLRCHPWCRGGVDLVPEPVSTGLPSTATRQRTDSFLLINAHES